jgi:hypothetical protein
MPALNQKTLIAGVFIVGGAVLVYMGVKKLK